MVTKNRTLAQHSRAIFGVGEEGGPLGDERGGDLGQVQKHAVEGLGQGGERKLGRMYFRAVPLRQGR